MFCGVIVLCCVLFFFHSPVLCLSCCGVFPFFSVSSVEPFAFFVVVVLLWHELAGLHSSEEQEEEEEQARGSTGRPPRVIS